MRIDPKEIRRSVIAGSWYPGSADELRQTIDGFLGNVPEGKVAGELIGLIAPHAGYIYSGQVAAYAYKQLEDMSFKKVVIVSPVHQFYPGRYIVTTKRYYQTPLGLVEVDAQTVEAIGQEVSLSRVDQDNEHSLEIQLPFLQRVLGDFKLVPIMLGDQALSTCQALSEALAGAIKGENALLVATTDLSHYHDYDTAVRMDKVVLKHVEAFDPEGLARDLAAGRCEACGGGPVIAAMLTAKALGADKAEALEYVNSGDVTGDRWRVVGYMAGALYRGYPAD
ncbi:MAG: AmmeMemoRadiSam system protein B [Dehalococcoidia bacterium]